MSAPIQIRKADTVARLRRLAAAEGRTITDLVDEMARQRDRQFTSSKEADYRRRLAAVNEAVARFNALPTVGPLLTDDDLYDEDGLPK